MGTIKERLIESAVREWEAFGRSTRSLDDRWHLVGLQRAEPFRSRVGDYWAAVGRPDWDGDTPEPWSAAFISWCFAAAGAGELFSPDETHSVYIDRIRRHDGMAEALRLCPPPTTPVTPGDLIWNARSDAGEEIPQSYDAAVAELEAGNFFYSHVDIVVSLAAGRCDSIGGNVSNLDEGSVTRSTWRLDSHGVLVDPRKPWIGVVRNGL